ncbi:hypothetical protein [Streptomyces sp. NPDC049881]|uniref:hypothetical protein n=1 Tax=Streptomyces sp. NPDC049881 TaxID=3155778 RepID=UPI003425B5FB
MVSSRTQMHRALRARAEEAKDDVIAAYESGESLNSLRFRLGVSSTWLTRMFGEWGVPIRGQREAFDVMRARRER